MSCQGGKKTRGGLANPSIENLEERGGVGKKLEEMVITNLLHWRDQEEDRTK